jgi:hypothetical protein
VKASSQNVDFFSNSAWQPQLLAVCVYVVAGWVVLHAPDSTLKKQQRKIADFKIVKLLIILFHTGDTTAELSILCH